MKVHEPIRSNQVVLRHVQELVAALDRRVPQIERLGEIAIAEEAAALKMKAMERIAQLLAPAPAQ